MLLGVQAKDRRPVEQILFRLVNGWVGGLAGQWARGDPAASTERMDGKAGERAGGRFDGLASGRAGGLSAGTSAGTF